MYKKSLSIGVLSPFMFSKRTLKIMKLLFVFLFAGMLSISASTYSQSAKVSIKLKNATVSELFDEIRSQTPYSFWFNANDVDINQTVQINAVDKTVKDVLEQALSKQALQVSLNGNHIVLTKKAVLSQGVNQNTRKITGSIKDQNGEAIIGASIQIDGLGKGSISDLDGNFTLEVIPGNKLIFSYIGYTTQQVTIKDQTHLNIILKEDSEILEEVVVTALGIKKESKALSYNVQQVKSEELVGVKDASFVNSLTGKVAGVTINASASGLGGSTKVVMRGDKSVNADGNNNALYVLDGIPLPDLFSRGSSTSNGKYGGLDEGDGIANFNPEDIETITVLTGPSSAALYGGQAANGVIMITTKSGSTDGKPVITYSNSTDIYNPFILPEFQRSYGSRLGEFSSWGPKLEQRSSFCPSSFFETGMSFSNSVGIQFGNEKYSTYLSLGSYNAQGIIKNNDLDRYNISFNGNYKINKKLTLGATMMYMKRKSQNMIAQGDYYNPIVPLYLFPRGDEFSKYEVYERYDSDRSLPVQFWPYGNQGKTMQNPYWIVNRNYNVNNSNRIIVGGSLKYDFFDWLNVSARIRKDKSDRLNEVKNYATTESFLASDSPNGSFLHATEKNTQTYADIMANLQQSYKDFGVNLNVGASMRQHKYTYAANSPRISGAPLSKVPNLFSLNNVALEPPYQEGKDFETQAVFFSSTFDYKSKVFLDITGRNEWTSLLANTKKNSFFYSSFGLSGIISDMVEMPKDIISFLKVRASYAEVGNVPMSLAGITIASYPVNSGGVSINPDLPLDNLKFERTKSWELGMNMRFFKDIFGLDITYYNSNTFDQLFKFKAPLSSGYANYYINAGKVNNKGIEAVLHADVNIGKVKYRPSLAFTLNRNKIKELVENVPNPITGDPMTVDHFDMGGLNSFHSFIDKGRPIGDIYTNSFKRDANGYIYVNPNDMKMEIDNTNLIYSGNVNPKFGLSFKNDISYKNFTLSFLIDGRFGGRVVSATQAALDAGGASKASADARDAGGVLVNGIMMDAETYYTQAGGGAGVLSNYVYSATNVRLREASLTYNYDKGLFGDLLKGISFSITGRNLFMFYNKAPFDPQMTSSLSTFYQGIDYFMMPSLRSFGCSLRLKF